MKSDVLAPTEEHALSHEVLSVALLLLWLRQTRLLHATCSETVFFFQSPQLLGRECGGGGITGFGNGAYPNAKINNNKIKYWETQEKHVEWVVLSTQLSRGLQGRAEPSQQSVRCCSSRETTSASVWLWRWSPRSKCALCLPLFVCTKK